MKKTILLVILFLFLAVSVSAQLNYYYEIEIVYQNGDLSYSSVLVEPSQTKLKTLEGKYIAEVVSFDNEILEFVYFLIPMVMFVDTIDPETGELSGGGIVYLNRSEVTLYVPYYQKAKEINIYDWDLNKKLTIPVASLAKDTYVTEETKLAKEIEQEEEKSTQKSIRQIFIIVPIGLALIVILVLIIIFIKRRKQKRENIPKSF